MWAATFQGLESQTKYQIHLPLPPECECNAIDSLMLLPPRWPHPQTVSQNIPFPYIALLKHLPQQQEERERVLIPSERALHREEGSQPQTEEETEFVCKHGSLFLSWTFRVATFAKIICLGPDSKAPFFSMLFLQNRGFRLCFKDSDVSYRNWPSFLTIPPTT